MTARRTKIATGLAATALAVGGLGVLAAPAGAATATPSATAAACDRTPWEGAVEGTPKGFAPGAKGGDYLWHDANGFHLRVTHGTNHDERVYSGEITASAPMRIDPVKLEKGDTLRLSADHRTIVFVFANYGYVDGVDFHTDCASTLTVSHLHAGNTNLPTGDVYLGKDRAHPKAIPFAVHRAPVVKA